MKRFHVLSLLLLLLPSSLMAQSATISQPATEKSAAAETSADANKSVNPGINAGFLDPEMDVQAWVERFEVESREVYHARDAIMAHLKLKQGDRVADVGAGTGFYSLLMASAVGPNGWVYAVDISPKFVQYLVDQFDQRDVENVTTVICDDDSVCLPPDSVDLAFICDVYHHFEFPEQTMQSIFNALRPGGRVVIIDFERIPGVSREWTIGHVRAGKETFIDEVQSVGFQLTAERKIPGFKENYFLEFRKPGQASDE
ncbi:methyltransferase type 11 [Rhodopirellula maiorica SM1]|uniref:Methyltransferase type 11 n=1 Tax=Rhodopirellula maiorica SM1 TaxID=1265738 RepID=M5REH4_9BACT|nr:class I SAM-dependent methyltransferase [Rhodopirellula maiorica]EMI17491.1 methyltransferase type 11 [Rhodopirellula maiorica SM1]